MMSFKLYRCGMMLQSCLCKAKCSMNPVEHTVTVSMFKYKQPNLKKCICNMKHI